MTTYTAGSDHPLEDPVSNVLKWVLLAVAVGCFALFAWATVRPTSGQPRNPTGSSRPAERA